jgi:hypothetical protein
MKYANTLLIVLIFGAIIFAGIQRSTGITGRTNKTNLGGCTCHSPEPDNNVTVQITGPDTLVKGETGQYQITLSGGPAVKGGFNVASKLGTLAPVDNSAQLLNSELTHTSPKIFSSGSVSWSFTLTAANQAYVDTIFSASNSVNGDGFNSALDRWNFGQKFAVQVIDQPSAIDDDLNTLKDFTLNQNYPNPFNPSTKISWQSSVAGHQTLKVYDVTGKEVATLVDEYKPAGSYNVQFTINNELSSGVYFYKLQAGDFVETKKMILMK